MTGGVCKPGKDGWCELKLRSMRARALFTALVQKCRTVRRVERRWPPGMFVAARGSKARAMRRWCRAAERLKRNEFVYVVRPENTIDIRQVRPRKRRLTKCSSGKASPDGERVVVSVLTSPRQGMEVTPIDREGTASTPAPQPQQPAADPNLDIRRRSM